jgi:hypothetical protein
MSGILTQEFWRQAGDLVSIGVELFDVRVAEHSGEENGKPISAWWSDDLEIAHKRDPATG